MKVVLVALALVAVASAAPIENTPPAYVVEILRSLYDLQPEGGYRYGYESADGTKREETGSIAVVTNEETKEPQPVVVVKGSYSYNDNEGKLTVVNYEADENGYRAFGDSIPKGPGAQ